jgi:sporulation protein YlmC with PRC-barrel domain
MNHTDRDTDGRVDKQAGKGAVPILAGAKALVGEEVYDANDEYFGDIEELMLEMSAGKVVYAILSVGGFVGLDDLLFPLPWSALKFDTVRKRCMLNVDRDRLKDAPRFEKEDWPDMTDPAWAAQIHLHYGTTHG